MLFINLLIHTHLISFPHAHIYIYISHTCEHKKGENKLFFGSGVKKTYQQSLIFPLVSLKAGGNFQIIVESHPLIPH